MPGRVKFLVLVLVGGGVAYGLHQKAGGSWGRSGGYPVVKKVRGGLVRVGDAHALKLHLDAPASETRFRELEVPEEVFETAEPNDVFAWSLRTVRPLGVEAADYRLERRGQTIRTWQEGYFFYWGGIGGAGLAVGLLAAALVTLVGMALGMGKIVKD